MSASLTTAVVGEASKDTHTGTCHQDGMALAIEQATQTCTHVGSFNWHAQCLESTVLTQQCTADACL